MKETKKKTKKKRKNNNSNSTLLKLVSYNPKKPTSQSRKRLSKILKTVKNAKREACQKG